MKKLIKRIALIVGGVLVTVVAAIAVLMMIGVRVDLSWMRGGVEATAGAALEREVRINGPVTLQFSSTPGIQVNDVSIGNVPGATTDQFLRAGLVRLSIGLLPLLSGDVRLGEVTAHDVTLNLESDVNGRGNWNFTAPGNGGRKPEPSAENTDATAGKQVEQNGLQLTGLDQVSLERIVVGYHDAALNKTLQFKLDALSGAAAPGRPVEFSTNGALQDQPFDLSLRGDALTTLARRNEPWQLSLQGDIAGAPLNAKGRLVPDEGIRALDLEVSIGRVDVGATLAWFGIVENLEAKVGGLNMKLLLTGNNLKELVSESTAGLQLRDGQWTLRDANTQASLDLTGLTGDVLLEQGNAATIKLNGNIEQTPVAIAIIGAPLADYVNPAGKIPLTVEVDVAQTRLSLASTVTLPMSKRDLRFKLKIDGERLDVLNDLFKLDLPPIGPLALGADLALTQAGYDLSSLSLHVGESRLDGKLNLDTSLDKPKLEVELVSPKIQIDDFDTGVADAAASADAGKPSAQVAEVEKTEQAPKDEAQAPAKDNRRQSPLSYEVLNSFDAEVNIEARQILAGEDELGAGVLKVSLQDARLAVAPLRVDVPGGGLQTDFSYQAAPSDVIVNLKTNVEKFDLGVLARRARPDTDMGGRITLDVALNSRAPDLESMMVNAQGHFDFALVPENFSAGIIDLWAVNLLSAVMSGVTKKDESDINCVVVRFGVKDGVMKEKAIYLDTTKMRVAGDAEINFKDKTIDMVMAPKAKKPQFFSLATPIQIKGTFDDFGLGIRPGRLTGTVVSFVTSPITVPFRRIFSKDAPEDGEEACMAAWTKTVAE